MRLAAFIEENKKNWLLFEDILNKRKRIDPEKLTELYISISDNLSYAATYFPDSDIVPYLNNLASKAHQKIYRNKYEGGNRMYRFFKEEFPLHFYHYRKYLLISFLIFVFFAFTGWYSVYNDESFVRLILGDAYVNMTLENIDKGDPMAVYKQGSSLNMFLGITINNIMVAVKAFALGVFLGIGTLYIMMYNGVMLGSFLAFFAKKGLLWESFRTIWIHGTIEIFMIIMAGAAGLVLGASLLFPGTYTRLESFKRGAKSGLKILVSTIPFFIIAGFLEGFVTKHTEMPDFLALFIIFGSLILVVYYYVFYPVKVYKKHKAKSERNFKNL